MKFFCCLVLGIAFFLPRYMEEWLSHFDFFKLFFYKNPAGVFFVALMTLIAFFLMNFLVSILVRVLIAKIEKDNREYLKNFGYILQVKVEDIESGFNREGKKCRIISLKSEKKVFEKNVMKDPFGYLDFGDIVNLFIDPEDDENYYIELEEQFDLPINIARMKIDRWKQK